VGTESTDLDRGDWQRIVGERKGQELPPPIADRLATLGRGLAVVW
jgi:hypothetical protein